MKVRYGVVSKLAFAVLITLAPLHVAQAYVDPNSAGPLYQLLFPLLVAIGAAMAAGKRALRRLWNRVAARIRATRIPPAAEHRRSDVERST